MSDDTPRPIIMSKKGDDLVLDGEWPQVAEFAPEILALPEIKTTVTVELTHTSAVYEVYGATAGRRSITLLAKLIQVNP